MGYYGRGDLFLSHHVIALLGSLGMRQRQACDLLSKSITVATGRRELFGLTIGIHCLKSPFVFGRGSGRLEDNHPSYCHPSRQSTHLGTIILPDGQGESERQFPFLRSFSLLQMFGNDMSCVISSRLWVFEGRGRENMLPLRAGHFLRKLHFWD